MSKFDTPPTPDPVETFEDNRELSPNTTGEQLIAETFEKANEEHPNTGLRLEEKQKIEALKKELSVDSMIEKAMNAKDKGDEKLIEVFVPAKKVTGLKKVALATTMFFAGLFGANAANTEHPPSDSTKTTKEVKVNTNEIKFIEDEREVGGLHMAGMYRVPTDDATKEIFVVGFTDDVPLGQQIAKMQAIAEKLGLNLGTSEDLKNIKNKHGKNYTKKIPYSVAVNQINKSSDNSQTGKVMYSTTGATVQNLGFETDVVTSLNPENLNEHLEVSDNNDLKLNEYGIVMYKVIDNTAVLTGADVAQN